MYNRVKTIRCEINDLDNTMNEWIEFKEKFARSQKLNLRINSVIKSDVFSPEYKIRTNLIDITIVYSMEKK